MKSLINIEQYKFLLLISSLWIFSCGNEDGALNEFQLGYHYIPLAIGQNIVYQTDSIYYQKSNNVFRDTSRSFIREFVSDTFRNAVGDLVFNVEIYYRKNEAQEWDLIDNSFVTKTKTNVIRQDNGLNYVKMIFPVLKNKSWNGNIQLDQNNELKINGEFFKPFKYWNGNSYYYREISDNLLIGNITYNKVVTVEESDYEDDLNRILSISRYAQDVGLVYRELWILTTENFDLSLPWEERAHYGVILKQTRIQ
ncbi:MAG: hypothetical protein HOP11_09160 [Saprospiraceae bacterium]|nr:hypothetical protein [Saprospiraceae bacterium]